MTRQPRNTGFSDEDRAVILHRSGGYCERCNKRPAAHMHHRKPRRMGGRHNAGFADVNRPSNGLALCEPCHRWAETGERDNAKNMGIILAEGQTPDLEPVFLPRYRGWVLLDDDGGVHWHTTRDAAYDAAMTTATERQK